MRPHFTVPARAAEWRRRQYGLKTLMMAVAVAAAWLAALRLPGVAPLVFGTFGMALLVTVGFAGLMLLGWLGFGLFAALDRLAGRRSKPPRDDFDEC